MGAGVEPGTSADDEAFVAELATSLVVLIARWRERAALARPEPAPGTLSQAVIAGQDQGRQAAYIEAARELEAVLRSAT